MAMTNRFSVSFLSRKNKSNSINDEFLANKDTGEILFKTPVDGDIISFDKLARLKNHIDTMAINSINLGITGDLYNIEIPDKELPEIIGLNTNLLDAPLNITNDGSKRLLISLDIDCLEMKNNNDLVDYEPLVQLEFKLLRGMNEKEIIVNSTLITSNSFIIDIRDFLSVDDDPSLYSVDLKSIKINKNPNVTTVNIKTILYSILIIVE